MLICQVIHNSKKTNIYLHSFISLVFLSLQALNWLLRSVTQPTCLHDLLWCFVAALTPTGPQQGTPAAPAEDINPQNQQQVQREKAHDLVSMGRKRSSSWWIECWQRKKMNKCYSGRGRGSKRGRERFLFLVPI